MFTALHRAEEAAEVLKYLKPEPLMSSGILINIPGCYLYLLPNKDVMPGGISLRRRLVTTYAPDIQYVPIHVIHSHRDSLLQVQSAAYRTNW